MRSREFSSPRQEEEGQEDQDITQGPGEGRRVPPRVDGEGNELRTPFGRDEVPEQAVGPDASGRYGGGRFEVRPDVPGGLRRRDVRLRRSQLLRPGGESGCHPAARAVFPRRLRAVVPRRLRRRARRTERGPLDGPGLELSPCPRRLPVPAGGREDRRHVLQRRRGRVRRGRRGVRVPVGGRRLLRPRRRRLALARRVHGRRLHRGGRHRTCHEHVGHARAGRAGDGP